MPREARDPSDPRDWLRRVRSNLARAQAGPATDDVLYDDLCFDAQQAAEKALKAVLVAMKMAFPKTHSIERLVGLVREGGVAVPEEELAVRVARWAEDVVAREWKASGRA